MRTPVSEGFWDSTDEAAVAQRKAMMASYLVRRPGDPDDPAWVIAMLASPHSAWITGQTIPVNGGYSFAL